MELLTGHALDRGRRLQFEPGGKTLFADQPDGSRAAGLGFIEQVGIHGEKFKPKKSK